MDWLLNLIPWWAWLLLAAIAIGAVWRLFGWRGAVAAAGLILPVLGFRWSVGMGAERERARQAKARDNLQEHYDEIDRQDIDPSGSYDRLRGMQHDKDRG
ncbi:MAG: hypothetical protein ACREX5_01520 [Achromobacter pestifer]